MKQRINHKVKTIKSPTYNQGSTIPVKGVRKAIAQNITVTEIPHGWMMIEADAANLVKTRNHHKMHSSKMKVII